MVEEGGFNMNKKRTIDLTYFSTRLDKLHGVKNELKYLKNKIDDHEAEIFALKKDNKILRKILEDVLNKFNKRKKWEYSSTESQKRKLEESRKYTTENN